MYAIHGFGTYGLGGSDEDEVATASFKAEASVKLGGNASATAWMAGGGTSSLSLPGFKAKKDFEWEAKVFGPLRAEAVAIDKTIRDAAERAYPMLLERKGIIAPGQAIPDKYKWKNFRRTVRKYDSAAGHGWAQGAFMGFAMNKALEYGYDNPVWIQATKARVDVGNSETCGDSWPYCSKYTSFPRKPSQKFVNETIAAFRNMLANDRLRPLREGFLKALEITGKALDDEIERVQKRKRRAAFAPGIHAQMKRDEEKAYQKRLFSAAKALSQHRATATVVKPSTFFKKQKKATPPSDVFKKPAPPALPAEEPNYALYALIAAGVLVGTTGVVWFVKNR
jgi:hypothetical protein